jgi:5'-nucleotidase
MPTRPPRARALGRWLGGALLVLVLGAGCAARPACDGAPVRVQLLLVNDVYQLEPDRQGRGGLARVATLVRALRRENPNTLFALAGDTLSPSLLSTLVRGRQMVEAWNLLGLDAATFGNHEFDWGPAVLQERMRESRFAWTSANVLDRRSGRPFGGASPWLREERGGVFIGLVGLTAPDSASTSTPGPDVGFAPPLDAARAAFEAMGPVDLRVALTHLTLAEDRALAAGLPLHAILGGHDHDPMLHADGPTVIMKAGSDAVSVGQLEYEVGCGGRILARRQRLLPVDATVAAAPDVTALVARYAAEVERQLDRTVARTAVALDARTEVIGREPSPLGAFLAEAMRERVGAEVALLNSGAIRGNRVVPAGPLTARDVRELLPFDNVVVVAEVSGETLRAALERSVASLPRPAGHYLQTAGLEAQVDPGRPAGSRVGAVMVRGAPLEPGRRYRVAMIDYLARGGDGYTMLAPARLLLGKEDGPGLIQTVLEALAAGRSP